MAVCGYKCYYYSRYTAVISLRQIVILLKPRLAPGGRRRLKRWRHSTELLLDIVPALADGCVHLLPDMLLYENEKIAHPGPQRVLAVGKHYRVVLHGAKCHPVAGSGVRRGGK